MVTTEMPPGSLDETGAVIIERDPAMFWHVLNYLDDKLVFGTLSINDLCKLQVESDFYQISGLEDQVKFEQGKRQSEKNLALENSNSQLVELTRLDGEIGRLEGEIRTLRDQLGHAVRMLRRPGSKVDLKFAEVGDRVRVNRSGWGHDSYNQLVAFAERPRNRRDREELEYYEDFFARQGKITSTAGDSNTEMSVMWPNGEVQHGFKGGKRNAWSLEYC